MVCIAIRMSSGSMSGVSRRRILSYQSAPPLQARNRQQGRLEALLCSGSSR